jgi:hypothetical protein
MDKTGTITDAIQRKRILRLDYHGVSRTVMPHILGHDGKGHLALSAYQVGGTGNGWRMFHVDEANEITLTEKGFGSPRHDYNPDDPAFGSILAQL